jgi:ketosteroid isomerase-like protein
MKDADQILAVIDGMFAAFGAHDPAGVEAALDPDCTIWDVFVPGLIVGPEARRAFHEADRMQSVARGPLRMERSDPLISVWGDIALARYVLSFEYAPPNAVSGDVRISTLFRRHSGAWRIVHHHEGLAPAGVTLPDSTGEG